MLPDKPGQSETIVILDFGSQYAQLIARRIRENHVFSVLVRPDISPAELRRYNPRGLIFSGGPASVYACGAPRCRREILEMGIPILGICYGMQVACEMLGVEVAPTESREYGRATLEIKHPGELLKNIPRTSTVWMSHADQINELGGDFVSLGSTRTCPAAAVKHASMPFYGVQFHPEVAHTPHGNEILSNFLFDICKCRGLWQMGSFISQAVDDIRRRLGDEGRVVCGLSGGVDSSVAAALVHKAVGDRLTCIFVDNGMLRENEPELVRNTFAEHFEMNMTFVSVADKFLQRLEGVVDPQEKRRIIGHTFIDVFSDAAANIPGARYLAQGTLYPDVIESGKSAAGDAANIKIHHNVGGLPEELDFELIEPLRDLFKDEVRRAGELLGLPEEIIWRHPFPGPGLAVRCVGQITPQRLNILRKADNVLQEEIRAANLYRKTSQTFAVLLPVRSVGVMGDGRTYENVVAIRSVDTADFMTADWSRIPYDVLASISNRIINEVAGVNRVVYDVSSKPPATIEWE